MVGLPKTFGTKFDVDHSGTYVLEEASKGNKTEIKPLINKLEHLRDAHWTQELKEEARQRNERARQLKEEAWQFYVKEHYPEGLPPEKEAEARADFEKNYEGPAVDQFTEDDFTVVDDPRALKYRIGITDVEINKAIVTLKGAL